MRHHLLYVGIIAAITLSGCSRDNNDIMPPSSVPDINTGIEEVKPVQKIQLLELKVGKANNRVQQP